jgi:hypothetical protein
MAIKTDTNSLKFVSGRGDVSANVAKSDSEVVHEESEVMQLGMEDGIGDKVNDFGAKPVFATPNSFHTGRGLGRGHGPETK